jgi:polysaccharide biosynthesis protein PslH
VRVVIASDALPLPLRRADARWLYVIASELARRSVDVTCVSCTDEPEPRVDEAAKLSAERGFRLRHIPKRLSESRLRRNAEAIVRPKTELRRIDALRAALLEELNAGYDVLHLEHPQLAWAAEEFPRSVVYLHHLELVDWEGRPHLSLRERRTFMQLGRSERRVVSGVRRLIVASRRLQREVARFRRTDDVPVVPVALDPTLYDEVTAPTEPVVGVIGTMDWYPSRSAAERVLTRIWPSIVEQRPDARLVVAGWNAERFLGHLFPVAGATLVGAVASPQDFFTEVGVLLYPPPRGSGMKIKVLEAMAYGVPVVTNGEGAEGLDVVASIPVAEAESDAEFIRTTLDLLADPERRERMRRSGRSAIEDHFSPGPAVDRLLETYRAMGLTS